MRADARPACPERRRILQLALPAGHPGDHCAHDPGGNGPGDEEERELPTTGTVARNQPTSIESALGARGVFSGVCNRRAWHRPSACSPARGERPLGRPLLELTGQSCRKGQPLEEQANRRSPTKVGAYSTGNLNVNNRPTVARGRTLS
jgi:hypothetical protein